MWRFDLKVLAVTVGTSFKTNLEREGKRDLLSLLQNREFDKLYHCLKGLEPSEKILGAEINSIQSLLEQKYIKELQKVYLLVSDTSDGEIIGKFLERYIEKKWKSEVEILKIEGLTDADPDTFRRKGLVELVKKLAFIKRKETGSWGINATGGYKAQVSYASAFGQVHKVPVFYMHERFGYIIDLPSPPVTIDLEIIHKYREAIALLAAKKELEKEKIVKKTGKLDDIHSLIDEVEGKIWLSALGYIYWEAYKRNDNYYEKSKIRPPGYDGEIEEVGIEGHHRPRGFKEFIRKLEKTKYIKKIEVKRLQKGTETKIHKDRYSDELPEKIKINYSDGEIGIELILTTTCEHLLHKRFLQDELEKII